MLSFDESDYRAEIIGHGRGVFSDVWRVRSITGTVGAPSVVVKMPRAGPNGDAARRSGAYDRERLAYSSLLIDKLPVPHCFGISDTPDGPAIVLDDLTSLRFVDQLDGLHSSDVLAVVDSLAVCHRSMDIRGADALGVRRNTPSTFSQEVLSRGLRSLPLAVGPIFASLLEQMDQRVAQFAALTDPVLCHGDPRADNVAFDDAADSPSAILYDWQQIAIQAGEADLAWLLATSVDAESRRMVEPLVMARYAQASGRSLAEVMQRYRIAMVVPGLAVLLLAQRRAEGRLGDLVRISIERIAAAVEDHLLD